MWASVLTTQFGSSYIEVDGPEMTKKKVRTPEIINWKVKSIENGRSFGGLVVSSKEYLQVIHG